MMTVPLGVGRGGQKCCQEANLEGHWAAQEAAHHPISPSCAQDVALPSQGNGLHGEHLGLRTTPGFPQTRGS